MCRETLVTTADVRPSMRLAVVDNNQMVNRTIHLVTFQHSKSTIQLNGCVVFNNHTFGVWL
jgi:hypothetical protein